MWHEPAFLEKLFTPVVNDSMHLSRPVGWQDTAQGWKFEFPGEKQCYKNEEQEWFSLISALVIGKKGIPLWAGPAATHPQEILIPWGLGAPRIRQDIPGVIST